MALRLGDEAPNFNPKTTEGTICFHEWLGDSWGILFSHPKNFTPVCTTELGTVAQLKPQFSQRNVKIIAVSVDTVDDHKEMDRRYQCHAVLHDEFPDHRRPRSHRR